MFFQIKEIILWPRNKKFRPKRIIFKAGAINIITGSSRTGKSAIIPIVDYCLGSDHCAIPVKTIRNACEWFGVVIQTQNGLKLFARKEPGNFQSTGEMFVLEGKDFQIPSIINANANVADVKIQLDHLAGLTNIDFDFQETGSGYLGRPSFRDLNAFIFQPQNIIANHDVLFYKADTHAHREKLKNIFPYVLGAVNSETLAMLHEMSQLKKELRKKQAELQSISNISERWVAEMKSKYTESKELGLLDITYPVEPSNKNEIIQALKSIVSSPRAVLTVTQDSIQGSVDELYRLQEQEVDISTSLIGLRRRYAEMSELRKNASAYRDSLKMQSERLKVSAWLSEQEKEKCPICGSELSNSLEELQNLVNSLSGLQKEEEVFENVSPSFDREYEKVREELQILTESFNGIQFRRAALEKRSEKDKERQYEIARVERFIGNLEKSIEIYESLGTDSDLVSEIEDIKERITHLSERISEKDIRNRTNNSLSKIQQYAGRILPTLDVERPNDPVVIKIEDLALQVQSETRLDYLWEIGSGSNWLSYHVAIMLALHQFFLENKNNPVPSFLIIDQPSQVYFPKKLTERGKETQEVDYSHKYDDEDVVAVQKIFAAVADVVNSSKGNFQAIILDHAAENIWGAVEGVNLVDEWRSGKKLVPEEWLS
jgi:hypothetical protein